MDETSSRGGLFMHRLVSLSPYLLIPLSVCPTLIAAPLRSTVGGSPSAASLGRPESHVFAQQLYNAVNQVAEGYVRPVSRVDLTFAALAGLYESAQRPLPANLRAEVEKADASETMLLLFRRVGENVLDSNSLRGRNPVLIACQAMARSLDPFTDVVIGTEQRRTLGLETEGTGIGLEVADVDGDALPIKTVHPGSPAQRAGLRPGDEIIRLNKDAVRRLKSTEVQKRLTSGPPDPDVFDTPPAPPLSPVALTYRRPGKKGETTLVLDAERYHVETVLGVRRDEYNAWEYWADENRRIAHVRLTQLGRGTALELCGVVRRLKSNGLAGLILDLRWCPGGYLDEAVDVARLFLNAGTIATVHCRGRPDVSHRGDGRRAILDVPMVVLVNGDTMGGAELIVAALQDYHRAVVVGQRTRGKASVQTQVHLEVPQAGLKLTSGTFLRPNGKNLHRFPDSRDRDDWGVCPDFEFRVSPDLDGRLKQWWQQMTLRPGRSTERIPLDDPAADPCRGAALEALRRQ
jgi:C-terminal peptidase prc